MQKIKGGDFLNPCNFYLDIKQRKELLTTNVVLTQNDTNSIVFNIYLKNNSEQYKPVGNHAVIFFIKSDGTFEQKDLTILEDRYSYIIKGSELSVPGFVTVYVKIYDTKDSPQARLTPSGFRFWVNPDLDSEIYNGIESTEQYEALLEAFTLLDQLKADAEYLNSITTTTLTDLSDLVNEDFSIVRLRCGTKNKTVKINGELGIINSSSESIILTLPEELKPNYVVDSFGLAYSFVDNSPINARFMINTDGELVLFTHGSTAYNKVVFKIEYDI